MVCKLFGQGYILWRTNCFHRSPNKLDEHSGVPMHHDKHFQDGESTVDFEEIGQHLSIIIALDNINSSNGLFSYIPQSMTNLNSFIRDTRPYHRRTIDDHFPSIPKHLMIQSKLMPIPRNHFCLFHSGLLHGSVQSQKPCEAGRTSFVGRIAKRKCKVPSELATSADIVSFC
ncbi:phytanoyl-CoA dioxygenase family protein [Synechococcus sp. AH-736-G21]|nr:phytanoyl-CoA dioxygenase family protein [Synechococcus sp. AH-736-G21]